MNRIKLSPLAASSVKNNHDQSDQGRNSACEIDNSIARSEQALGLFGPLHYEPTYRYPLIVWLHGDGKKTSQLQSVLPQISMRNFVGVAPQGPVGNFQCGYYWDQDYDSIIAAEESIFAAVRTACQRFNIAHQRIFLVGEGSGGSMALQAGLRYPELFAGAACCDAAHPPAGPMLSRWKLARQLPVFLGQTTGGAAVESQSAETDAIACFKRLYASAFLNLTAEEYSDADAADAKMLRDVNRWIMEQIQTAII